MIVVTAPTSNIGQQVLANIVSTGEPIRVIPRAGIVFIGSRFLLAPSLAAAAYGVPAGT